MARFDKEARHVHDTADGDIGEAGVVAHANGRTLQHELGWLPIRQSRVVASVADWNARGLPSKRVEVRQ